MSGDAASSIRKKVLVVSADAKERGSLSAWLREAGFNPVEYTEVKRVAETAGEEHPDLIIVDWLGEDSAEGAAVEELCSGRHGGVPVLILTSDGNGGCILGEESCNVDCMEVPSEPTELMARVRAMLRVAADAREEHHPAARDGLTKVYNRRYFDERLEKEVERARRYGRQLSCVMVDIDGFHDVNGAYGHKAGDQILKILADILLASTRSSDIVARFGGEEFVVIVPETGGKEAAVLAERLRKRFEERALCSAGEHPAVTISCGVSTYPDHARDAETLVHMADSAVYRAKTEGRNRCVVAFSDSEECLSTSFETCPRILLVEDNDYNRCVAALVLRASGYEVLEANNAETGISLARSAHPDLVIIDLQIHGIGGLEATRRLVQMDETKDIPVVALTAESEQANIEELARAGCRGFITKPIDTDSLASEVQIYLGE